MDLTHDLSDCHALDEPGDGASTDAPSAAANHEFNNVAALAYARWETLRGEADLPSVPPGSLSDTRFLTSNGVQVAWDEDISTPEIGFLGGDLAAQFAGFAGKAWPNVPIDSPLVELLRRISQRAMDERQATEFDEQITDSEGWIRDCQGLALPFAGNGPEACLVAILFDLDDPIVGEPVLQARSSDGVLLLDQELDPDEMPRLAKAPPPPPVLFVCVSHAENQPHSPSRPKATPLSLVPPLAAARARWRRPSRNPAPASAGARQSEPPLLLIDPLEPTVGKAAPRAEPASTAATDDLLLSLQLARKQAEAAIGSEERSHLALYRAIGAAYDFALSGAEAPERLSAIITDAGLKVQARAPMTPIVKLIFGGDYDRSRLAEYALALAHAFRLRLPAGSFADFLLRFEGGLKGVLRAERRLRSTSIQAKPSRSVRMEARLRKAPARTLEPEGQEFALVIARRMSDGSVDLLGEVPADERLFRAAARKLLER